MIDIYESKFILIYCVVLFFLLGTIFGSFLNCMADRICLGIPWWKGRSKCDHCEHELGILDLFPIFSYLFLGGKCRYCGNKLSIKYLLSELLLGILFVFYLLTHSYIDLDLLNNLGIICVLFGLSICDIKSYEIPDGYIIFGCIWWLIFNLIKNGVVSCITSILWALVVAGLILLLSVILDKILNKETLGGGDIKLFFMVGLYLGPMQSVFNIFFACVIGLIFILFFKKDKIPFGPAISFSTYFSLIYGVSLLNWYFGLFI